MKPLQFLATIALAITTFTSCTKDSSSSDPAITVRSENNIAYGSNSLQVFDMYLPANRSASTTKVVIFIHGGGWSQGDKSDFATNIESFKQYEPTYAIFNINYRLVQAGNNLFPTQENDVKAAIDFIYNHRADYGTSDKIVLLGASAGGHLALLQGYKYSTPKIKAVVNYFGPSNMVAMYNDPASIYAPPASIALLFNGTPATKPTLYFESSPINYVTAQSPPTITFQGGLDPLIKVSQQTALKTKLDAAGVTNQYVFYPTEGHGWVGANLDDSYAKLKIFLDTNVQ